MREENNLAEEMKMQVIARIRTDFPTKFGIPRQGALADGLKSTLVFEPEFRDENALRGIEQFSHLWLIWQFSANADKGWSPTVRPPRLGGNERLGVFATRSPFRPNPIGLSCVKLEGVRRDGEKGMVLELSGADLMDGTPILDIKPYIPYSDSVPDAADGYTQQTITHALRVDFPQELLEKFPPEKRSAILHVLSQDPRPSYQRDPQRIYGFPFAGHEIRFRVDGDKLIVAQVEKIPGNG